MGEDRRKEIKYHLPEEKIDELLRAAEDDRRKERLGFLKNLYQGDTIAEAADREGRSAATGGRWADAWNEGGLEALMPSFGGGRPPKLDEDEQDELLELLREGQPWKSQEIQHLLKEEFDVEYHPDYLGEFLRDLGLSYAKPRPKRPTRPENPEEILDECVADALDEDSDEPHNKREGTTRKDGLSTMMSVRMAELSSAFSMRHNRNRTTIRGVCGTSMTHTLNGH